MNILNFLKQQTLRFCYIIFMLCSFASTVMALEVIDMKILSAGSYDYMDYVNSRASEVPLNNFIIKITFDQDVKVDNRAVFDRQAQAGKVFELLLDGAGSDLFTGGASGTLDISDVTNVYEISGTGGAGLVIEVRFLTDLLPNRNYTLSLHSSQIKNGGDTADPYSVAITTASTVSITPGTPANPKFCKNDSITLNPIFLSEASEYTFVRNTNGKLRLQFSDIDFEFAGNISDVLVNVLGDAGTTITNKFISTDKKRLILEYNISDFAGRFATILITGIQVKYVGSGTGSVAASLNIRNDRNTGLGSNTRFFINGLYPGGSSVSLANITAEDAITNTSLNMTGKSITGPSKLCKNSSDTYSYFIPPVTGAKAYYWKVPEPMFKPGANPVNAGFFYVTTTTNTLDLQLKTDATGSGNIAVRAKNNCEEGSYSTNYPVNINDVNVTFNKPTSIGNNTFFDISATSPTGGSVTYSGNGMVGSRFYGTLFSSKVYSLPHTVTITYTFTDVANSGCVVTGTFDINVFDANATVKLNKSAYCTNDASETFKAKNIISVNEKITSGNVKIVRLTPSAAIINPTYVGVSGPDLEFSFNPSALTEGTYEVQAQSKDTLNNNVQLYKAGFTMNPAPNPTIAGSSTTVCANTSSSYNVPSPNPSHTFIWSLSGGGSPLAGSGSSITINWDSDTLQKTYWLRITETNPLTSCDTKDSVQITVQAQPNPKITGDLSVCANSVEVYSVKGGVLANNTYSWEVTGGVIDSKTADNSQITVGWGGSGTGTVKLTQTNDLTNCTNNKTESVILGVLPTPTFKSGSSSACVLKTGEEYEINSVGTNHSVLWQVIGGTIQGGTVLNDTSTTSGPELLKVTIDWGTSSQGRIIVTETNSDSCKGVLPKIVTLNPLPDLRFNGLSPQYCEDDGVVTLAPTANGIKANGGKFIIRDTSDVNATPLREMATDVNTFDPKEIAQTFGNKTFYMTYKYTDAQGCEATSAPSSFRLNSAPEGIKVNISREANSRNVRFEATANGVTPEWTWAWGFANSSSSSQNTTLTLANTSAQSITYSLTVVNDLKCTFIISKVFNIDFSFEGKCLGSATQFKDVTNLGASSISSWSWDFGDGNVSTSQNPAHTYANAGTYYVTLTVKDDFISYSLRKRVDIFPVVKVTPALVYTQDFSGGEAGWISHGTVDSTGIGIDRTSWKLKTPAGFANHIPADKGNAWVTDNRDNVNRVDTNSNYNANEQSYVESPCFEINALDRPMVSFSYWSDTDEGGDGVALFYTINDGDSWHRVGEQDQGIDWYNTKPILGKPGNDFTTDNGDSQGWSGNTQTISNASGWKVARFGLDEVLKRMIDSSVVNRMVRFRVAFGSNSDNSPNVQFDGFAFDDFQVTNRNRLVLMEYFINQSLTNSATFDANTHAYAASKAEAINIHYHTGFSGADEINDLNTKDPSGRAFHYGVRAVPRPTLDGEVRDELIEGAYAGTWVDTAFARRTLLASPFLININQSEASNNILSVSANIQAIQALNRRVVMHIAVIEDTVTTSTGAVYYNAVRKMLPDAAGTFRAQPWAVGDSFVLNKTWDYGANAALTPQRFRVVVFVADYQTNEIYQAAVSNVQVKRQREAASETGNKVATSVANNLPDNDLLVYPNPAATQLNVILQKGEALLTNADWEIVTVSGQVVKKGHWSKGQGQLSVHVGSLASGVYIIKVHTDKATFHRRFEKH